MLITALLALLLQPSPDCSWRGPEIICYARTLADARRPPEWELYGPEVEDWGRGYRARLRPLAREERLVVLRWGTGPGRRFLACWIEPGGKCSGTWSGTGDGR